MDYYVCLLYITASQRDRDEAKQPKPAARPEICTKKAQRVEALHARIALSYCVVTFLVGQI